MSLLQPDAGLTATAMQYLKAKGMDQVVQPDLQLACLLLHRGLFGDANGALQAKLARALINSPISQSADKSIVSARTVLVPTMVAHFAKQGCYAQAAEMCAQHTALHPAYLSLGAGLHGLLAYLHALKQHGHAGLNVASSAAEWPLPYTLQRLGQALSSSAELALQRMCQDKLDELVSQSSL